MRGGDANVTFQGNESASAVLEGFTIRGPNSGSTYGIFGNQTSATIRRNEVRESHFGISGVSGEIKFNTIAENVFSGVRDSHGTITNNAIQGSIHGLYACHGTISNNEIFDNYGPLDFGAGLYNCDGTITGNNIHDNEAYAGGGLYFCDGVISNNEIHHNNAHLISGDGGGLNYCDAEIIGNDIHDNVAMYGGGLAGCDGTVSDNTIHHNSASTGGAFLGSSGTIERNQIYSNEAVVAGGGLYNCLAVIRNNVIAWNTAGQAGGALASISGTIMHNTIYGNSAGIDGGGISDSAPAAFNHNILWANSAPSDPEISGGSLPHYSIVQNWAGGGIGNLTADPLLYAPAAGDFHLSYGSPAINAGVASSVTADYDGEARPSGPNPDIGMDEFVDSDGDQMPDEWESRHGLSPAVFNPNADSDADGVTNLQEYNGRLHPGNPDSDGDGFKDGQELQRGTDPRDPNDYPPEIWVFFAWDGLENGSFLYPYNTVSEAVAAVDAGGLIRVFTGATAESPRLNRACRMEAAGGAVRIGAL